MENKKSLSIEIFGWYGVVAILTAYALLSYGVFNSSSLIYQILNLTGAIGIMVDAFNQKNYQPAVLNIVWFLIAIGALVKMFI